MQLCSKIGAQYSAAAANSAEPAVHDGGGGGGGGLAVQVVSNKLLDPAPKRKLSKAEFAPDKQDPQSEGLNVSGKLK